MAAPKTRARDRWRGGTPNARAGAGALALAALRAKRYRVDKRYFVFQALPHTLGVPAATWRLLSKCHDLRNQAEYEGLSEIDETLLKGLIEAARVLLEAIRVLPLAPETEP